MADLPLIVHEDTARAGMTSFLETRSITYSSPTKIIKEAGNCRERANALAEEVRTA